MRIPRVLGRGAIVSVCLMLAACSQSPHQFQLTDVTGHQPELMLFKSPTADGRALTAGDLRGKVVVLYFGYTHCPDICPTTLAKLKAVTQRLGERANELQVVFVTVDPKRDTLAVLKRYIRSFSSQFLALRPDPEVLPKMMSRYHIASNRKPSDSGSYAVIHTTKFLVFDQTGQMRLIGGTGDDIKAITSDIAYLISHQS